MFLFDLNVKVDLQKYCKHRGVKGLQFEFLPYYGWFAYSDNKILSFFDMMKDVVDLAENYRYICDRDDLASFKLTYSEMVEKKICAGYVNYNNVLNLFNESRQHILTKDVCLDRIPVRGEKLEMVLGKPNLIENCGLLTKELIKKYSVLHLNPDYQNHLLIPTWITPKHISSLEIVNPRSMETLKTIKLGGNNKPLGWYGVNLNKLCETPEEAFIEKGVTYNRFLKYWVTKPMSLSLNLELKSLCEIWNDGDIPLDSDPVLLIEKYPLDALKNVVSSLQYKKIKELEKRTKLKLQRIWYDRRQEEIKISGKVFNNKQGCYWLNNDTRVTNFSLVFDRIVKKKDEYFREGHLVHEMGYYPISLSEELFDKPVSLRSTIKKFFLENGIGLPYVDGRYGAHLISIVNAFNERVRVEVAQEEDQPS